MGHEFDKQLIDWLLWHGFMSYSRPGHESKRGLSVPAPHKARKTREGLGPAPLDDSTDSRDKER